MANLDFGRGRQPYLYDTTSISFIIYNKGMNPNEKRLFESYKELELLLKEKFNDDFDGVSEYIDRMNLHTEEGTKTVPDWEKTLKALITLRAKRNNIAHGKKSSGTVPEDVDYINLFIDAVKEDSDPLQKYYIYKGYIKIVKTPEHEDEQYVDFDDLGNDVERSAKSKIKVVPIVIVVAVLAVLILWVYMRMNASLL